MQSGIPLEIERKFLIRLPSEEDLKRYATRRIEMTQAYLRRAPGGGSRRVRCSRETGGEIYHYNEKRLLHGFTRSELETEISAEKYRELWEERDPNLSPIHKVRWCIPWDNHVLELDVYPFWKDRATLEIELESEEESCSLPAWIRVIKEVSEDSRYFNSHLAQEIPMEEI